MGGGDYNSKQFVQRTVHGSRANDRNKRLSEGEMSGENGG